jgi:putative membrane protein
MDSAAIDLLLAIAHHFLVFAIAALIAAELAIARPGLAKTDLPALGRVDAAYGACAVLVILIGIGRMFFGLKGWEFYVYNPAFWLKMAAFATVGLLSIGPTRSILRWRRAGLAHVPELEITAVRRWLKLEAGVFVLILVFAAAMARGVGM